MELALWVYQAFWWSLWINKWIRNFVGHSTGLLCADILFHHKSKQGNCRRCFNFMILWNRVKSVWFNYYSRDQSRVRVYYTLCISQLGKVLWSKNSKELSLKPQGSWRKWLGWYCTLCMLCFFSTRWSCVWANLLNNLCTVVMVCVLLMLSSDTCTFCLCY